MFLFLINLGTNVAIGQNATQFNTLEFGFNWTADKLIENCTSQDDPNNQQCCAATQGRIQFIIMTS